MTARDRDLTRRVFERAEAGLEPRMERLLDGVPQLVARAGRRQPDDFWSTLVPLARVAIPRFAMVSAVLALVSAGLFVFGTHGATKSAGTSSSGYAIEQWILDGKIEAGSGITKEGLLGLEVDGDD